MDEVKQELSVQMLTNRKLGLLLSPELVLKLDATKYLHIDQTTVPDCSINRDVAIKMYECNYELVVKFILCVAASIRTETSRYACLQLGVI